MDSYTRKPTLFEQILGVMFSALLTLFFGALAYFLISRQMLFPGAIFSFLCLVSAWFLYRAAFTKRRPLAAKANPLLALVFIALGTTGLVVGAVLNGQPAHRLMAIGSGIALLIAGLRGIRAGSDA